MYYQHLPDLSRFDDDVHFWEVFFFSTFAMSKQGKVSYNKQPKSFEEQVKLLKSRGLNFVNEKKAEKILHCKQYSASINLTVNFEE